MNYLSIVNSLFLWTYGVIVLFYILKNWNNPNKQKSKYSELVIAILLCYCGYNLGNLFPNPTAQSQLFLWILLGIYSAILIWLFLNVFPNYVKVRRNPQLAQENSYEKFYANLISLYSTTADAQKADLTKDISRKLLHFFQFAGILLIHIFTFGSTQKLATWGITEYDMRNYFYFIISGFFFFMMITADMVRMTRFEYLPKWASVWYTKSLEPDREKWTFNSAVPILCANMLFIMPFVPLQAFFVAAFTSCISDAMTSLIGKNLGKHKLGIGRNRKKSWEGLLAGASTTFTGVLLIFVIIPIGSYPILLAIICALLATAAFVYNDVYASLLCDNLLNSLIPGLLVWLSIIIFA